MIRLLDITFDEPAENLALEEVLLNSLENAGTDGGEQRSYPGDTLRFWESPHRFVVLGTAQKLSAEVEEAHCRDDGVSIMRRCSAGGCVLQGPGCLNFCLVLRYSEHPEARALRSSYQFILGRIVEVLQARGIDVGPEGASDLAWQAKKVSGNAQRRRRRAMLHHWTLLYRPDFEGMERYLRDPLERPKYRGKRTHRNFVRGLPCSPKELKGTIQKAFGVPDPPKQLTAWEIQQTKTLARNKYLSKEWICRR